MKTKNNDKIKNAVLSLKGANCASCAYTIEHVGRKINGVHDVMVNTGDQKIYVDYNGDVKSLEKICEVVRLIGYDASIEKS